MASGCLWVFVWKEVSHLISCCQVYGNLVLSRLQGLMCKQWNGTRWRRSQRVSMEPFGKVKNRTFRAALLSPASFLTSFRSGHCTILFWLVECTLILPQWGASDAEIKVPSVDKTEFKRSPFKAWSRSVYSHTCYTYCQGLLPCLFLPLRSIHLHFSKNLPKFSCVGCG